MRRVLWNMDHAPRIMDHRSNLFSNSCIQFLPSHLIFFSFCLVQLTMNTSILFILAVFMVSAVNSRSLPEGKNISQTFITQVLQLTCITFCKWLGMHFGSFKSIHTKAQVLLKSSFISPRNKLFLFWKLKTSTILYTTVRVKGGVDFLGIALNAN